MSSLSRPSLSGLRIPRLKLIGQRNPHGRELCILASDFRCDVRVQREDNWEGRSSGWAPIFAGLQGNECVPSSEAPEETVCTFFGGGAQVVATFKHDVLFSFESFIH